MWIVANSIKNIKDNPLDFAGNKYLYCTDTWLLFSIFHCVTDIRGKSVFSASLSFSVSPLILCFQFFCYIRCLIFYNLLVVRIHETTSSSLYKFFRSLLSTFLLFDFEMIQIVIPEFVFRIYYIFPSKFMMIFLTRIQGSFQFVSILNKFTLRLV